MSRLAENRYRSALVGGVLFITSVTIFAYTMTASLGNTPDAEFSTETTVAGVISALEPAPAISGSAWRDLLSLDYQQEMLNNQTASVSLYWGNINSQEFRALLEIEPYAFPVSLFSSGFEISPSNGRVFSSEYRQVKWTITPRSEGKHLLVLDATSMSNVPLLDPTTSNAFSVENQLSMELPVIVYTVWGVSEVVRLTIAGVLSLIGFALTYPIIIDLIRSKRVTKASQERWKRPKPKE